MAIHLIVLFMQWPKTKQNTIVSVLCLIKFHFTVLSFPKRFFFFLNDLTLQQASLNRLTFKLINNEGHFYKVKETLTILCNVGIVIIQQTKISFKLNPVDRFPGTQLIYTIMKHDTQQQNKECWTELMQIWVAN